MLQSDFEDSKSEDWVFLTSCRDEQEANTLESFLACENIFVLRKYEGAGDYLRIACGMTVFGIDLFVRKSQFGPAKEILGEVIGTMDTDKADSKLAEGTAKDSAAVGQSNNNKSFFIITGIALIIILGVLIIRIFNLSFDLIDYDILGK